MNISNELITIVLLILMFSVALNFTLTFRLFQVIRDLPHQEGATQSLPIGEVIPDLKARALHDKHPFSLHDVDADAQVMVFLSPKCSMCKDKLSDLEAILPAMQSAGVALVIVGLGSRWQMKRFFKDSGLVSQAVLMESKARRKLNPLDASPFYLFVDGQQTLQACGMLGDENWQSFQAQMHEIEMA